MFTGDFLIKLSIALVVMGVLVGIFLICSCEETQKAVIEQVDTTPSKWR